MTTSSDELSRALSDGASLVGSTGTSSAHDLKSVLVNRLLRYYAQLRSEPIPMGSRSLEEIQLKTAQEALVVVTRVQRIIQQDPLPSSPAGLPNAPPLLGTRDVAEIRTLLSITFKWGVNHLLAQIATALQSTPSISQPSIIDITTTADDYELLKTMVADILLLLFPWGVKDKVAQTHVTTVILDNHATDLLNSCLMLGWLPKSLSSDVIQSLEMARPLTPRILNLLPPSQAIAVLGPILSQPTLLSHVRRVCSSFLSQQLLRPQGVRGLCAAVFGESTAANEDAPIEKLEHVARVLTTVPAILKPQDYFSLIIPRVLDMLSNEDPPTNKRAASFTISRVLSADRPFPHKDVANEIILSSLHSPFLLPQEDQHDPAVDSSPTSQQDAVPVLSLLVTFISNADPSPTLIATLLSPIITSLYSLLHHLDKVKTSDPALKKSLRGMLITWGKIVDSSEGVELLWSVLGNEEGGWNVTLDGIRRTGAPERGSSLSLLTPKDLGGEADFDANILNLYPNPAHFTGFINDVDRSDIASQFFSRLLEAFRTEKAKGNAGDPVRTLLYLQIIMEMQSLLTQKKNLSNLLSEPSHILSFIKHVLDPIHYPSNSTSEEDSDSDDETPGDTAVNPDLEMTETSINLLLSVLEANEGLSARTEPILNDIFDLLEPLALGGSEVIGPLAREARMVMTARLASTSIPSRVRGEESDLATYQNALRLLQDPILPVRAHGLLLLRQLVTPTSDRAADGRRIDSALIPGILSIFLQSIQDDDSYLFLNAVKGLAAMVDTFGKDVLKGLTKEYAGGLEGLGATNLTQRELDIRIRVGEALASVIRRFGETLSIHTDVLLPPLFSILRSKGVPTALRMSAVSLLAECEKASPLGLLPYVTELVNAMIDILQIETVPPKPQNVTSETDGGKTEIPTMDDEPTSTDPKLPAFRRAAVHFLLLVTRATIQQVYDSSFETLPLPLGLLKRAKITLSYIASTDGDAILQVMAREASEELDQLSRAIMGV